MLSCTLLLEIGILKGILGGVGDILGDIIGYYLCYMRFCMSYYRSHYIYRQYFGRYYRRYYRRYSRNYYIEDILGNSIAYRDNLELEQIVGHILVDIRDIIGYIFMLCSSSLSR